MEAGDKKEIESGRDDNELKNWWVFLTPARRCEIHSLRQPTEYSSNRVGEGFRRCVSRQIRKWNPLVTLIRVMRLMGMSRDEERVTDTYVYLRLPWLTEKCLLVVQDGRLSGGVLLHLKI